MNLAGVVGLARRLVGRRDVVQALAVVALPLAVLLALFMTVHSLTLSPQQRSDMLFGRYQGLVQLGGTTHTRDGIPPRAVIDRIRRDAPGGQSAVVLSSPDLSFAELPRFGQPFYTEADWPRHPFGDRYTVLSGRLPRRVGEIAVTAGLVDRPLGRVLTAASGNVTLRIVGVIRDRFARSSTQVLGAAGTWASFDWDTLSRAGFSILPSIQILGNFRHWDRVNEIASRFQASQGSVGGTGLDRAMVAADPPQSFVEQEALVYRAPADGVAVLCPLLLLGLRGRRGRRLTAILRAIGIRPGRSTVAVTGGSIVLALAAIPVGAVAGLLLGLLIRLASLGNAPLSPPVSVLGETARFAVIAAAAMLAAGLAIAARQRGHSVNELIARRPSARAMLVVRLVAAVAAVAGIAVMVPGVKAGTNNTAISILAAIAVCLLIPEVLGGLRHVSARLGVRWRLVSSRVAIDRGKSWAVCAALIACIGPFVAISAERAAGQAYQRATRVLQIPEGQVAVGRLPNARFDRVDPRVLRITRRIAGGRPIEVTQLVVSRDIYANPPRAIVAPNGRFPQTNSSQALLGVRNVGALRRLLGENLTAHAAAVVARGGVAHFAGFGPPVPSRAPIGMTDSSLPGARVQSTTRPVPIASIPNDHAWSSQGTGFILNSTARRLGLPMHVHLAAFTNVSRAQIQQINHALERAGLPVRTLIQAQPFQYAPEPAGLLIGRYSLLLVLAVLMTIALGSSARSLRAESRSLIAIGLRPSWAQRALAIQSLALTAIGLLGGIAAGAVSIVIYVTRLSDFTVVVPVGQLLILVAGSLAIAVLTALLAGRRLTSRRSSS